MSPSQFLKLQRFSLYHAFEGFYSYVHPVTGESQDMFVFCFTIKSSPSSNNKIKNSLK